MKKSTRSVGFQRQFTGTAGRIAKQGFSTCGEYGGAATFLAEYARRGHGHAAARLLAGLPAGHHVCGRCPRSSPPRPRYGGLAIGYNLATSLFGGTTPLVVTGLINATGTDLMPAYHAMEGRTGRHGVRVPDEGNSQLPLEGSPPAVATEEEAQELINARFPASPY